MKNHLHGNAKTTPRIRQEIQASNQSIMWLAKHYKLNPKTIIRWKNSGSVLDKKSGPKTRQSVLNPLERQIICELRRQLKLPLDDVFKLLKSSIPKLTRSNLHRCLQYYGLSRLPNSKNANAIGRVSIDLTKLLVKGRNYWLLVAIDARTKYLYIELRKQATQKNAAAFLQNLQMQCAFKITQVSTSNAAQFSKDLAPNSAFTQLCSRLNIRHKITQSQPPWNQGQVEITSMATKSAAEDFQELQTQLQRFLSHYHQQLQLKKT